MNGHRWRPLHHFAVTIGFLTRIPVRHEPDVHMGRVAALFPIVGSLIGAITAVVLVGASEILSSGPATASALIAGVLVTGAFHLDGLADSADALVGGTTPQRRLEILKDSRHGTYGVAAIVCQILLQYSLVSTQSVRTGAVMFVLAHGAGRALAVSVMKSVPPAHDGLGAVYVRDVSRLDQLVAWVCGVTLVAVTLGFWGLAVFAAGIVVVAIFVRRCAKRIGGIVGDVLGASEQIAETLMMVGVVIVADHVQLWWM